MVPSMDSITKLAVLKAGGPVKVGNRLQLTRQAVSRWEKVPAKHVLALEEMSGVSRYVLRPDVYGAAPGPFEVMSSGTVAA
jgi:DNA-binding transcriptional regulator YdaS (Cro superfamily)